ncbi:MAG: methyltransferase domain-containing protein [Patescibacteria group bacterium]|nr:methyltransferase domain-containing protein [Patescibacteria group bacterium]
MVTDLHQQRLDAVYEALVQSGAQSVLDLGCGEGFLLQRLAGNPQFETIVGVDQCGAALWRAREAIRQYSQEPSRRLSVIVGSYADSRLDLHGFDACAMVETIEHLAPETLGKVERAVWGCYRPRTLVMTTPNSEYNVVFGLAPGVLREGGHRFEWSRHRFRQWATGVANRNGYSVRFDGIGDDDLHCGQPTQMAVFERASTSPS